MANPCGAVTRDQSQREKPPLANDDEVNYAAESDRSSNQVEQTRGVLAVLSQIVGPELGERVVLTLRHWEIFTRLKTTS